MNAKLKTKQRRPILEILLASVVFLFLVGMLLPGNHGRAAHDKVKCVNNLKQIGLALRLWSTDHEDQFVYNVSTNEGGTREFCNLAVNGFDLNGFLHLRALSNELSTPKVLLCPADTSKIQALDFQRLGPDNVSYQLRSGTNLSERFPQEVLAICPIHNNCVMGDGSVQQRRKH